MTTIARTFAVFIGLGVAWVACAHHVKVDPVEVKPIKMTIDVNIKIDRELDEFFEFEERLAPDDTSGDANRDGSEPDADAGARPGGEP